MTARPTGAPARTEVVALDAARYVRHGLHQDDVVWLEKNCYVDVWIEALHALGAEPLAMLPFTVGLDWEGDQWTFFKPVHAELTRLYGLEIHELNPWRGTLLPHAVAQVAQGRLVFTEADAWWLPDTAGTDYRQQHTKTTIVINQIDVANKRLGYFHNAGYFTLEGEDFAGLLRTEAAPDATTMPFYAEFVRIDRLRRDAAPVLVAHSRELLRSHLGRLPAHNPVDRFAAQFPADVAWLQDEGLPLYHGYAFATLRQLGANFELTARYLGWLAAHGEAGLEAPRAAFTEISDGAKALVLKTARAVHARRTVDFTPLLASMAAAWDAGTQALRERYA